MDVGDTLEWGGYEYEFVETCPEAVMCRICRCASKEPYMSVCCGHPFCKSCLVMQRQATSVNYACPVCRSEADFITVPYVALHRIIAELHVYCTNKEKGCEWQGELNDINSHFNGCQFQEVQCSNNCGMMIQRRYLDNHVHINCSHCTVNCHYCHVEGECHFIKGQHQDNCPKFPLPCPYECGTDNIPRDELGEHMARCSLEEIRCEFYNVGCDAMIARNDLKEHNRTMVNEHHQLLVEANLLNAQNMQEVTQQNMQEMQQNMQEVQQNMQEVQQNMQEMTQQLDQLHRFHQQVLGAHSAVLTAVVVAVVCLFVRLNR